MTNTTTPSLPLSAEQLDLDYLLEYIPYGAVRDAAKEKLAAVIAQARTAMCQPKAAMYQPTGAMCQPAQQATASRGEPSEREAFEAWALRVGYDVSSFDAEGERTYAATFANVAWEAWQAARASHSAQVPDVTNEEIHTFRRLIECAEKLDARPRPMCRDCADEDGTCPTSGLECDMRKLFVDAKRLHDKLVANRASSAPTYTYEQAQQHAREAVEAERNRASSAKAEPVMWRRATRRGWEYRQSAPTASTRGDGWMPLYAHPAATPASAQPVGAAPVTFEAWWNTPHPVTSHPPAATLDLYSAREGWDAAVWQYIFSKAAAHAAPVAQDEDAKAELLRESLALCDNLIHTAGSNARALACDLRPKIERAMLASTAAAPASDTRAAVPSRKRLSESAVRQLAIAHASACCAGDHYEFNQEGLDAFALDLMAAAPTAASPQPAQQPAPCRFDGNGCGSVGPYCDKCDLAPTAAIAEADAKEKLDPNQVQTIADRIRNTAATQQAQNSAKGSVPADVQHDHSEGGHHD